MAGLVGTVTSSKAGLASSDTVFLIGGYSSVPCGCTVYNGTGKANGMPNDYGILARFAYMSITLEIFASHTHGFYVRNTFNGVTCSWKQFA